MTHPTQHLGLDELERLLEEDGKIGVALSYRLIDRIRELEGENARLREALGIAVQELDQLIEFHDSRDKPCGDYDRECPIAMKEWFDKESRARIDFARQALKEKPNE